MEPSSLVAMGLAAVAVAKIVIGIAVISLVIGAVDFLFGKPKFTILKPSSGGSAFAFSFSWNDAKEPAKMDYIKLRLFNPHGSPTQVEVTKSIPAHAESFATDVDMGRPYLDFLGAENFDKGRVTCEVGSSKDGVAFTFEMRANKFRQKIQNAIAKSGAGPATPVWMKPIDMIFGTPNPNSVPARTFIADTVPGSGDQLVIPSNPAFENLFSGSGDGGGGGAAQENFAVSKVWIAEGCIVCNACEDIFPEVFDVQADTCLIRPDAPLTDGLKIQDAADACPTEVIKFDKIS